MNEKFVVNKSLINDFIQSCGFDFLFMTETWLNVNEIDPLFEMAVDSLNLSIAMGKRKR